MNSRLASYLYSDELLYLVSEAQQLVKDKVEKIEEPSISTKNNTVVQNDDSSSKSELKNNMSSNSNEELELISEDEFVFRMKSPHLFVFSNLDTEEKDFLLKILQALGLSFTKVDLLDIRKFPLIDFKQTIHENVVRTIVFFGEESGKDFLPKLRLKAYEPKNLKNINFLYADSLTQVAINEANEKRLLWAALKTIFQN